MTKRKCNGELVRFVWKRNIQFDIMLLSEVEAKNPFAFKNSKQIWEEIAVILQNCPLKMRVTYRSCRERVTELLKVHRGEEHRSKIASGIEEPEMTDLKQLLTSVATLHEGGRDKDVSQVYAKNGRLQAEAIRNSALLAVHDHNYYEVRTNQPIINPNADSSNSINENAFDWSSNDDMIDDGQSKDNENDSNQSDALNSVDITDDDIEIVASTDSAAPKEAIQNAPSKPQRPISQQKTDSALKARVARNDADLAAVNIFFNDNEGHEDECDGDRSEKMVSSSRKSNPKRDLVRYLENKSEKEYEVRKEELNIRKEEVKIRDKEIEIKKLEAENKSKELDILLERAKSDAENQKRLTDMLISLINK